MVERQERRRLTRLHQNAQRLLRPLAVVNPFAEQLTFPDHRTRMRRDHTKYLGLIEAITLLHQYQRPVREVEQRGEKLRYIEVTRGDIELANRLAHEVLGRSLDELPPQTRRLLGLVDELVGAESKRQGLDRCDTRFSRVSCEISLAGETTQLKVHLGGWWSWSICSCIAAGTVSATNTSWSTRARRVASSRVCRGLPTQSS